MFAAFFIRKIFLQHFSVEYLGIYYIFNSIFGILIALDCGISSSVFFKIYKPIEQSDEKGIASVFSLIRLVYTIRGFAVFIIGTCICFFLPTFVKITTLDFGYIKKCYIIYMLCNSTNYLVIFYQFFLESVQKRYIVSIIDMFVYMIGLVAKIYFIVTNKYVFYLFVEASTGIIVNIICCFMTYKMYPYLRGKIIIRDEDKKGFFKMIGMAFHSLSTVIVTYTDAFLISIFAGVYQTGLYGNYKTLNNTVQAFMSQISSSTKDSMRSLIATGDKKGITNQLYNLTFLMFWIGGICCVCLSGLSSRFISIWLGDEFLLPPFVIISTAIALYLSFQNFFIVDSYYATECFVKDIRSPIKEIMINLVLSVLLGMKFGIFGIMVGTIAYYISQMFFRIYKLFNNKLKGFGKRVIIEKMIKYTVTIIICSFVAYLASNYTILSKKIFDFLIWALAFFFGTNLVFFLLFHRTKEFCFFKDLMILFLQKKLKNKKKII